MTDAQPADAPEAAGIPAQASGPGTPATPAPRPKAATVSR